MLGHQDCLGGSGAAIDPYESANRRTGRKLGGVKARDGVLLFEVRELLLGGTQARRSRLRLLFESAYLNIVLQLLGALIPAHIGILVFAKLHRSQCSKVLGVFRGLDELL